MSLQPTKPKPLDAVELQEYMDGMYSLKQSIKALEKQYDEKAARVIATLKPGGVFQFNLLRMSVVQQWRRKIDWKHLAFSLARQLYPNRKEFFFWVKALSRSHKKEPQSPYVLVSQLKSKKKDKANVAA